VAISKRILARETSQKGNSCKRWYGKKKIHAGEMTCIALQGKVRGKAIAYNIA